MGAEVITNLGSGGKKSRCSPALSWSITGKLLLSWDDSLSVGGRHHEGAK